MTRLEGSSAATVAGESFVFPATFAQRRLWFLDRLGAGAAYTIARAGTFRLTGPLDVEALRRALDALVRRHESLRTTFKEVDGEPVQVVTSEGALELEIVRLESGLRDPETALDRLARETVERPFDLETGPLARARLARLGPERHVLWLTLHHIVSDGWSMGVLFRDLSALYESARRGVDPELPELPVQLADVAVWERERLRGERLDRLLGYWRERLEEPPELGLPHDRRRPETASPWGDRVAVDLDASLVARLGELAREEGATRFMALLAGFAATLGVQTGADEVVVGSPVAGRTRRETEDLIGLFVNPLPLRLDTATDLSFRELLRRTRETCLGAFDHQDLPFERIVEALAPERRSDVHPLFQTAFALQDTPNPDLRLAGLEVERLELGGATLRFDLECHLRTESSGRVSGHLIHSRELFESATAERLVARFERLLTAAAAEPDRPVGTLDLIDERERTLLLEAWNGAVTDFPRDATLHGTFERLARERPDAPALRWPAGSLSYGELDARADRLARRLEGLGTSARRPVGVALDRSPEAIVAVLATLKSGSPYLPLDPEWPERRIRWAVADAGLDRVIGTADLAERLEGSGARLLDPYDEGTALTAPAHPPLPGVDTDAGAAAYVMYTSGSTGAPKGVAVPHRAVVRLLRDTDYLSLDPKDRVLHVAPLAFDASVFEMWAALLHGATLVILPRTELSLSDLAATLRRERITTTLLTTALFHELVEHDPESLSGVRQLLTGGDVLSPRHARRALEASGGTLLNAYGPTEGAVISCCHRLAGPDSVDGPVPIGRPIANTRVYVLDRWGGLAPIGAVGELAIGGDGLALGYDGRGEETAERFGEDPFSSVPGARLYRTGDLARWRNDGTLEFHGRRDLQVKIGGVRVEPTEIETALLSDPEVESAAVDVRPGERGEPRIVAWIVPRSAARAGEQIERWRDLFDETYDDPAAITSPFAGWNSSFTGRPIPEGEMREWVDETVARIAAYRPRRLLEVGCGTGLLVRRLASGRDAYVATDFSEAALARVRAWLDGPDAPAAAVRLECRGADDLSGLGERFDAVVLNSIAQYFPGVEFLDRVIRRAVDAAADGGVVFVGDVRDLSLLETFHAAVLLARAGPDQRVDALRVALAERVAREPELVVDPVWFARLPERDPRVAAVEIRPKRGRSVNELTTYRYDVVLHIGAETATTPVSWLERGDSEWSEARVREALAGGAPGPFGLPGVADTRTGPPLATLAALRRAAGGRTVADLMAEIEATDAGDPVPPHRAAPSPQRLRALAQERGLDLELFWSGERGRFDAVFTPTGEDEIAPRLASPAVLEAATGTPPTRSLANVPWTGPRPDPATAARARLADRLPAALVPSRIVAVDHLPLGPTGKVDRRALPEPAEADTTDRRAPAPGDPLEAALVEVWQSVLGRPDLGLRDDFFELGGHSLLGVRLLAEIEKRTGHRVPLQSLFRFSTVESMARSLREAAWPDSVGPATSADASALSAAEVRDLMAAVAGAGLLPLTADSPMVAFHTEAAAPPLFWCFNVPSREPGSLAAALGERQPLYAMISGVGVLDWRPELPGRLAEHYLERLLTIRPEGPYRIGGNCAGARVAVALTAALERRGRRVERLCLLEHFEPALYDRADPLLLLHGRESHLEIPRRFRWGKPGWHRPFRRHPRVAAIPGEHGQFFDPGNVRALATVLGSFLDDG